MTMFLLNSKIDLITEDDETTRGLIHDIIDEKLYVSIITDDKQFKLLYVGDRLRCVVFEELTGTAFDAVVTNRILGDIPTYELSELSNFQKIQRRQDVRISCTIPVFYTNNEYLLNLNMENIEKRDINSVMKYSKEGWMVDLSAGGLKFTCGESFKSNDEILLAFDIKDKKVLIKGQALHKEISISSKKTLYSYGIRFIDISEEQREKIIGFLFVLMRKNRLK